MPPDLLNLVFAQVEAPKRESAPASPNAEALEMAFLTPVAGNGGGVDGECGRLVLVAIQSVFDPSQT
jgi:hypothetical protein